MIINDQLLVFFLAIYGFFCLYTSILVGRSALYKPTQKVLQVVVIWFLPILGSIVIWLMLRLIEKPVRHGYREFGGGASYRGDEHGGL